MNYIKYDVVVNDRENRHQPTQYLGFSKPEPTAGEDAAARSRGVTDKGLRNLCAPSADPADFESKIEVLSLTNLACVTDSMLPMVAATLTRLGMNRACQLPWSCF